MGLMALSLTSILALTRPGPAQSDTGTSPWISPTSVATGLSEAATPSLAFTRDGVARGVANGRANLLRRSDARR